MSTHSHVDAVTAALTGMTTLGWWWGVIPGFVSLMVGVLGCIWYILQIVESEWWKKRQKRLHRRRVRRGRHHGNREVRH